MRILMVFLLAAPIVGCNNTDKPSERIFLECSGKWYNSNESPKWGEKVSEFDFTKVIELKSNVYNFYLKRSDWQFKIDGNNYYTAIGNSDTQPGNPSWSNYLSVTDTNILYRSDGSNDYDVNKEDSDGMNQKHQYSDIITINRVTGEYEEDSKSKTYWKDGSWLAHRSLYKGSCRRGALKF